MSCAVQNVYGLNRANYGRCVATPAGFTEPFGLSWGGVWVLCHGLVVACILPSPSKEGSVRRPCQEAATVSANCALVGGPSCFQRNPGLSRAFLRRGVCGRDCPHHWYLRCVARVRLAGPLDRMAPRGSCFAGVPGPSH